MDWGVQDVSKRQPENRQKTGSRKLRSGRDPSIGKKTPFQPGQSSNPGGRPRMPITYALRDKLGQLKKGDPMRRTFADLIADAQIRKAVKGNTMAAKEVADRVEGEAGERLEVAVEAPLEFNVTVNFVDKDGSVRASDLSELADGEGRRTVVSLSVRRSSSRDVWNTHLERVTKELRSRRSRLRPRQHVEAHEERPPPRSSPFPNNRLGNGWL